MRICSQCGKEYSGFLVSHSNKYCSEECRKIVRAKVNANGRMKRKQKIDNGDVDFIANDIFLKYKQKAPKRNLEFSLTLDFFKKHVNANCYYCDEPIGKVGFDRKDNSIGYTEANSVPCCASCNFMKRTSNDKDFIDLCIKIAEKHKEV